jgi:hypothetical protein
MPIDRKEFEELKRKLDTPLEKKILDLLGQNKDAYEFVDIVKAVEPESMINLGLNEIVNPPAFMRFYKALYKLEKEDKILKATDKNKTYYTLA